MRSDHGATVFAQLTLGFMYLVCAGVAAHALLGIARTAATRLPRSMVDQFYVPLFTADYSGALTDRHGMGRKVLKIIVLTVGLLIGTGGTGFLFYGQIQINSGFVGGEQHQLLPIVLHVIAWVVLAAYAIYRGVSRAVLVPSAVM